MKCDKDNTKTCPHRSSIQITGNGQVSCDSKALLQCCRVQDQMAAARQFFIKKAARRTGLSI